METLGDLPDRSPTSLLFQRLQSERYSLPWAINHPLLMIGSKIKAPRAPTAEENKSPSARWRRDSYRGLRLDVATYR